MAKLNEEQRKCKHTGTRRRRCKYCRLPPEVTDAKTGKLIWEHPHWRLVQDLQLGQQDADMSGGPASPAASIQTMDLVSMMGDLTPVGTTYTTEGNSQHPEAEQEAHQLKLESAPGGEKLGQRGDLPAVPGVAAVSGFHKEKSVGALPTGHRRASQLGSTQAKARERAQVV